MDDSKIIELFWTRAETAITETANKYSKYCFHISYNILHIYEDVQECVNDTFLNAWNAIPPHHPNNLPAFLGKITRNLSLQRYVRYNAKKRGMGQVDIALDELEECIPSKTSVEKIVDEAVLTEALDTFLRALPKETRAIFVLRYWYLHSIKEISECCNMSESKVKSILFRTRKKLKAFIEREDITI